MKTIEEIAAGNSLEIIETTPERNGYPSHIKQAIIGFDSFEEAEKLAKENGLEIEKFERKYGWDLWVRGNCRMYDAFVRSAEDMGDNYRQFDPETDFDDLKEFIAHEDDFEDIEQAVQFYRELLDKQEIANDDEIVIMCNCKYYDTIAAKAMHYCWDSHEYVIGLIRNE